MPDVRRFYTYPLPFGIWAQMTIFLRVSLLSHLAVKTLQPCECKNNPCPAAKLLSYMNEHCPHSWRLSIGDLDAACFGSGKKTRTQSRIGLKAATATLEAGLIQMAQIKQVRASEA